MNRREFLGSILALGISWRKTTEVSYRWPWESDADYVERVWNVTTELPRGVYYLDRTVELYPMHDGPIVYNGNGSVFHRTDDVEYFVRVLPRWESTHNLRLVK